MSEPVIEVRHLSKSFGTHVVLRDVDFTVNAGDVTCIIGASGSGKSTLLRCINLLETPTNGKVLFHGSDITAKGSDPCAYRAKVGMVFQSFNLFNNMTVLDNCAAGCRMLSALVGCGFLSGEACTVVVVRDFAGGDGDLRDYGSGLDGAGNFSGRGNSEGSFRWMDSGRRCDLLYCFAGDQ